MLIKVSPDHLRHLWSRGNSDGFVEVNPVSYDGSEDNARKAGWCYAVGNPTSIVGKAVYRSGVQGVQESPRAL